MDANTTRRFVDEVWDRSIFPALNQYIAIPNKSPSFDHEWETHGHMERALQLIVDWCKSEAIPGATLSVERLPGRTPLIFIDVPSSGSSLAAGDCVLLYGHYDKQPE